MTHPNLASLADSPVGSCCVVRAVLAEPQVRLRLLELGLLPGTEVRVVRRAPLGDAIELHVRGYALSLRREQALGIRVEPLETTPRALADAAE